MVCSWDMVSAIAMASKGIQMTRTVDIVSSTLRDWALTLIHDSDKAVMACVTRNMRAALKAHAEAHRADEKRRYVTQSSTRPPYFSRSVT